MYLRLGDQLFARSWKKVRNAYEIVHRENFCEKFARRNLRAITNRRKYSRGTLQLKPTTFGRQVGKARKNTCKRLRLSRKIGAHTHKAHGPGSWNVCGGSFRQKTSNTPVRGTWLNKFVTMFETSGKCGTHSTHTKLSRESSPGEAFKQPLGNERS